MTPFFLFDLVLISAILKETAKSTAKGKGKAKAPPVPVGDSDEESEAGLEYDENHSLMDTDESSGSEFVASDEEEEEPLAKAIRSSPAKKRAAVEDSSDEDGDAIMLEAAMQLSLQTVRNTDTAGLSSSSRAPAANSPAAFRAATIEKRLAANAKSGFDVDDSAMDLDDLSALSDSDAEPLAKKSKAKAKAKGKVKSKSKKGQKDCKVITMADIRQAQKEGKREERALRKKLGRKLTWVSQFIRCRQLLSLSFAF